MEQTPLPTTRAEEIAGNGPYRVEKSSGVYVIMGPQGRWTFHFSHESTAKERADDLNAAYKQGQQDRWIPIAEWKEPLAGTLVVRLSDGGYPELRAWKAMGHDHIPKWITHFMILPSPPNPEQR